MTMEIQIVYLNVRSGINVELNFARIDKTRFNSVTVQKVWLTDQFVTEQIFATLNRWMFLVF